MSLPNLAQLPASTDSRSNPKPPYLKWNLWPRELFTLNHDDFQEQMFGDDTLRAIAVVITDGFVFESGSANLLEVPGQSVAGLMRVKSRVEWWQYLKANATTRELTSGGFNQVKLLSGELVNQTIGRDTVILRESIPPTPPDEDEPDLRVEYEFHIRELITAAYATHVGVAPAIYASYCLRVDDNVDTSVVEDRKPNDLFALNGRNVSSQVVSVKSKAYKKAASSVNLDEKTIRTFNFTEPWHGDVGSTFLPAMLDHPDGPTRIAEFADQFFFLLKKAAFNGIIHCDLKRGNLLYRYDAAGKLELCLTDFDSWFVLLISPFHMRENPGVTRCLMLLMASLFLGELKCRGERFREVHAALAIRLGQKFDATGEGKTADQITENCDALFFLEGLPFYDLFFSPGRHLDKTLYDHITNYLVGGEMPRAKCLPKKFVSNFKRGKNGELPQRVFRTLVSYAFGV
jgi:hypothetical protein